MAAALDLGSSGIVSREGSNPSDRTRFTLDMKAHQQLMGLQCSCHPTNSPTTPASSLKAFPRWLIAFFSAAVSSAQVRVSPRGCRIGS